MVVLNESQPLEQLTVACVQLHAGANFEDNINTASGLIRQAADAGAQLILLPEKWTGYGSPELLEHVAESSEEGPASRAMAGWALEFGVTLIGGSITKRQPAGEKFANTTFVYDSRGCVVTYQKIHPFDVVVDGQTYCESDREEPGTEIVSFECHGWTIGLSICYDLRFPELYRELADRGALILAVPAAFTATTGAAHWEVLLRARAIENQAYVLAAGQWGDHGNGVRTYGHSMIVDPWGEILAEADPGDRVITATILRSRIDAVRATLPSLANRKLPLPAQR